MGLNVDEFKGTLELQADVNMAYVYNNVAGQSTLGAHVSFGGSGTVVFEATFDGDNWFSIKLLNMSNDTYEANATVPGNYLGSIEGFKKVRFRVTSPLGGKGSVKGRTTDSPYVLASRTTAL